MSATLIGRRNWGCEPQGDGHREYFIEWIVNCSSYDDGPQVAMTATGLAEPGDTWSYGNDSDSWAFCVPGMGVKRNHEDNGAPGFSWIVSQRFSTRLQAVDQVAGNPLTAPFELSGAFVRQQRQADKDRFGDPIVSTTQEPLKGDIRQRYFHTANVQIGFNTATNQLGTFAAYLTYLNSTTMWGCPARTVMFAEYSWEKRWAGSTPYFHNRLGFEVDITGWDKSAINAGVLHYDEAKFGDPDAIDPGWTIPRYRRPELLTVNRDVSLQQVYTFLDSKSRRLANPNDHHTIEVEHYSEMNLLTMGIPSTLN